MTAHVHLLGRAAAQVGNERIDFLPDKRFQLLAFLAYSGAWVSREKLSYLFWPDTSTDHARHNLRQLLRRVQSLDWVSELDTERQRIRWNVTTDVAAFRTAVETGDEDDALRLFVGPLLSGLESDGAGEFSTWLAFEREHVQSRWRKMILGRAADRERAGQHERAIALLQSLLESDPLDEEVLQHFMRVATQAGKQATALNSFQVFSERLDRELGLEPAASTRQLAKLIRAGAPSAEAIAAGSTPLAVPASRAAPDKLPHVTTSFVGRVSELDEIVRKLEMQGCRLITLLGPGGVGKSRLALQAAHALSEGYGGQVYFVSLESLPSADFVPTNTAEALGLSLQGKDPAAAQIARFIAQRQMLIVLDNFEHVSDAAVLVSDLLGACPHLKMMVTSRERLKLTNEWLIPLEGLRYLDDDHLPQADASRLDAVQLFLARARQVQPNFEPTRETLPHVLRICRLVEGSPLGIELAASWVRAIPILEIAEEIEKNLDFLSSANRDGPERHQSLRATFEYSWSLSTEKEQEALRRLAVFVGGFTREAAAVVADTSTAILAALIDKSLLRLSPGGRYDRHSLLYSFMLEKLTETPAEQRIVVEKHSTYFFHFLDHQWRKLLGQQASEGLSAIAEDFENILLGWQQILDKRRVEEVLATLPILTFFFDARVRYRDGVMLFEQASSHFAGDSRQHARVLGNLHAGRAWLWLWLGDFEQALHLVAKALDLLESERGDWGFWLAHRTRGFVAFFTGHFEESASCWHEELIGLKDGGRFPIEADLLGRLALAYASVGDIEAANRYLDEALPLRPSLGKYTKLTFLLYAGFAELTLERPQSAQMLLREAEGVAHELGDVRYLPHLTYGLGLGSLELGSYTEAREHFRNGLTLAEANDDLLAECWACILLGRACLVQGEHGDARDHLFRGVRAAHTYGFAPTLRYAMVAVAELEAREGRTQEAAECLEAVIGQPASDFLALNYAHKVLGLFPNVPEASNIEEKDATILQDLVEAFLSRQAPRSNSDPSVVS